MKKLLPFLSTAFQKLAASFGVSELLFITGMILLYSGISGLFSNALAQTISGAILAGVGVWSVLRDK